MVMAEGSAPVRIPPPECAKLSTLGVWSAESFLWHASLMPPEMKCAHAVSTPLFRNRLQSLLLLLCLFSVVVVLVCDCLHVALFIYFCPY